MNRSVVRVLRHVWRGYLLYVMCVAYGMLQTSWCKLAHVIAPSLGLPAAAKANSEQYLQQEGAIK